VLESGVSPTPQYSTPPSLHYSNLLLKIEMDSSSKKVAIPVWEGRVSPVFDAASTLLVCQLRNKNEIARFETCLDEKLLTRRASRIEGLGIDTLICGAISRLFQNLLAASGIEVISWVSGTAEEVLKAYLEGTLAQSRFSMPGRPQVKERLTAER
jgi:predicted Fe-Mo cluster-binding NifX family protein